MGWKDIRGIERGQWMALMAALLGWMFDGLEQALFPLVGRPALRELLGTGVVEQDVAHWFAVGTACYLVGGATGGVLFGWLGDRIGRVRAMTLSVLTYALFSGLCAFVTSAPQIVALRFVSSLGMGGEWSLGVALVMEVWPDRSRSLIAGFIGAAANAGYLLLSLVSIGLTQVMPSIGSTLQQWGLPEPWTDALMRNSGWRFIMLLGAVPALLTFFIRLFVPESERWQHERGKGSTVHWATRDLLGVLFGSAAGCGMIYLWARSDDFDQATLAGGTVLALILVTLGYLYPVMRYLQRSQASALGSTVSAGPTVRRMLLGACLGGTALLGTWASMQWAPTWADQLTDGKVPNAKVYTQTFMALGAIVGTILGALLGDWVGRRAAYSCLCLLSLGSALLFFQGNHAYIGHEAQFLFTVFVAGGCTAAFYGWLPLYLPELFPTRVRATGQGFSYNFGRMLAAVGALQTASLMGLFKGGYPQACSIMSLIYLVGLAIIWLAPETRGKPLPE